MQFSLLRGSNIQVVLFRAMKMESITMEKQNLNLIVIRKDTFYYLAYDWLLYISSMVLSPK